jgi:hypothetical protein
VTALSPVRLDAPRFAAGDRVRLLGPEPWAPPDAERPVPLPYRVHPPAGTIPYIGGARWTANHDTAAGSELTVELVSGATGLPWCRKDGWDDLLCCHPDTLELVRSAEPECFCVSLVLANYGHAANCAWLQERRRRKCR